MPSLELATEDFSGYVGGCSPGFSCAYMNTISWSSPKTPLPMETNPRAVFERLFGQPGTPAEQHARLVKRNSILDSLAEDAKALERELGPRDRARLGDYLDNVREIERRIQQAEARGSTEIATPEAPLGTPDNFDEHVALMFDLAAAAFQADVTRVFTFMMSRELSQRTYPQSASRNSTIRFHTIRTILENGADGEDQYLLHRALRQFSGQAACDAGRRWIAAGSFFVGIRSRNGGFERSCFDPLPLVLMGGAAGKGARHVELPTRTPIGNLWRNVAERFGANVEQFGDSTGKTNVLA